MLASCEVQDLQYGDPGVPIIFFRYLSTSTDPKILVSQYYFPGPVKIKIILRLIKRLPSSENYDYNSTLEDQHRTEHEFSANSFQNKRFPRLKSKAVIKT
jgi:hypothetical protein